MGEQEETASVVRAHHNSSLTLMFVPFSEHKTYISAAESQNQTQNGNGNKCWSLGS
jgi:hypothetical protein